MEAKIKSFANILVIRLGEIDTFEDIETKAQEDDSLAAILRDRKFRELVTPMKDNFDKGYEVLLRFSNQ